MNVNQKKPTLQTSVTGYTTFPLKFRNEIQSLSIITVPLTDIYYRANNHRIQCALREYITRSNGKYELSLLKSDTRRKEVQEMIEHVLETSLQEDSEQLELTLMKNGQTDPLVLTAGNITVNGNSRLLIMKQLYESDPVLYAHFQYIRCVYLPDDATEAELDEFEIQEQLEPDITAKYIWYEVANWMKVYKQAHSASIAQVAKRFQKTPAETKKSLHALEEGEAYLHYLNKPYQYRLIQQEQSALETLYTTKANLAKEPAKQKLAEEICYNYLALPRHEKPERLYVYFREIGEHIDKIEEALLEYGPISTSSPSEESEEEQDEIEKLFNAPVEHSSTEKVYNAFQQLNSLGKKQARVVLERTIKVEQMKKKDKDSEFLPEMEMQQSLDHFKTSFAHYTSKNKEKMTQYLKEFKILLQQYEKKVDL